jgi:hypothetical protein
MQGYHIQITFVEFTLGFLSHRNPFEIKVAPLPDAFSTMGDGEIVAIPLQDGEVIEAVLTPTEYTNHVALDAQPISPLLSKAALALPTCVDPPIHYRRLDHFVIRNSGVRFQNECECQHCRGYRWLPALCFSIQACQLFLERFIEQFVAMPTQKDEQFRFANLFDNLLFLLAERYWGSPNCWLHALPPGHFS